jgi:Sulfotransferase family
MSSGIDEASYLAAEAGHGLAREYLALLRRIGPQAARVTDKAPFNHIRLGLIHLLLPQARIIHCRRHPVDTCLSMYFTYFSQRMDFAWAKADLAFAYRQYARLMEHWRAALPRERFTEVDYEDLIADREAVTRRLIAFTGLDWHDACLSPERNKRTVRTASLWQARQPVYTTSVARWRRYEPWLGELRELLPPSWGTASLLLRHGRAWPAEPGPRYCEEPQATKQSRWSDRVRSRDCFAALAMTAKATTRVSSPLATKPRPSTIGRGRGCASPVPATGLHRK